MHRTAIIHAEQIRLLYANAPAGFVATVLNVVLLALVQWPVIAPPRLVAWLAAMLALTALRAVGVWRFQHCAPAPPAIHRWGTLFGLGTLGAGLGWGSAGVWLFPVASLTHQVFLAFVLGGMLAGAVGLLAARMPVFLSFACPAAVPIIVHLLAQGDRIHVETAIRGMQQDLTGVEPPSHPIRGARHDQDHRARCIDGLAADDHHGPAPSLF